MTLPTTPGVVTKVDGEVIEITFSDKLPDTSSGSVMILKGSDTAPTATIPCRVEERLEDTLRVVHVACPGFSSPEVLKTGESVHVVTCITIL